ncbi:hypothetical protein L3073_17530 [Ancylomarina sp. DW003]|nr:hypothetical protein [Ancylomarina sp. DW003]MDE5424020.1 hypothetical protein [Ancylomarina sp. DW003]
MKFLKYLCIGLGAILALFIVSSIVIVVLGENEIEKEIEETRIEKEKNRIVITEPTKSFMEVELKSPGKDPYIVGKCNFPDSTELSIMIYTKRLIKGEKYVNVYGGEFSYFFKKEIVNADSISIRCVKLSAFQSPNLLKQLALVDTATHPKAIEYEYSMVDLKRASYQKLLEYEAPQELDMSTVEVEDWTKEYTFPTHGIWKRKNIKIKADPSIEKEEITKQMKHLIVEELVKDATIVGIRANLCDNEGYPRWRLIFAPNGDWGQEEFESYSDYKLVTEKIY